MFGFQLDNAPPEAAPLVKERLQAVGDDPITRWTADAREIVRLGEFAATGLQPGATQEEVSS